HFHRAYRVEHFERLRLAELDLAVLSTQLFGKTARVVRFVERSAGAAESERVDLPVQVSTHERDDRARIHAAGEKRPGGRAAEPPHDGGLEKIPVALRDRCLVAYEGLRVGQPIPRLDGGLARDRIELDTAPGGNTPHIPIQRRVARDETVG